MRYLRPILLFCCVFTASVFADSVISAELKPNENRFDQNSWYKQGEEWLQSRLAILQNHTLKTNQSIPSAKNVIVFVGDGMSITTLTTARIWQGQQQGLLGEEHFLHFERFPHTALIKTYNSNQQTPDSAGTMSAMMTGVKTRAGLISMGPEQDRGDCNGSQDYHQQTLLEWGHQQGFDTGVVTTARLTHATPAATYAHSPERGWEGDFDRRLNAYWYGCDSIAKQLVETAFPAGLDLAFGGGASRIEPYFDTYLKQFPNGRLITDQSSLEALTFSDTQREPVLGVFASGHMAFEYKRLNKALQQPSLSQMTAKALQYFQHRQGRYLLVIEGARIDHAHHNGNAANALLETASLANAVQLADEMTSDEDTLIIVTADHSHTLTMAGYPQRGNSILSTSKNQKNVTVLANDGLPYTTLGYANGTSLGRQVIKGDQQVATDTMDFKQGVAVPLAYETHGSDDVALHAKGPGAFLFSGLMEQHEIFHTILEAVTGELPR